MKKIMKKIMKKYEFFSRYYKKAKKFYFTQSDSGVLLFLNKLK